MLTTGLEAAIQKGIAQAMTFTFGAGGVARLQVPKNHFIVIHHYDFFHFLDQPDPTGGDPALGSVQVTPIVLPPFNAQLDFQSYGTTANFIFDPADLITTAANAQAALTALLPGWTVVVSAVLGDVLFEFATTAPGAAFNGIIPSMISAGIAPGQIDVAFIDGTAGFVTPNMILARNIHQFTIRSKKSRNHWVIPADIELLATKQITDGDETTVSEFIINPKGYYSKDCYLVHEDSVQFDITTALSDQEWDIRNFSLLPNKSQEYPVPDGYGQTGAASAFATLREVWFSKVAANQQYLPLSEQFETIAANAARGYRDQLKFDVTADTILNPPGNSYDIHKCGRTYPVVNIDYVLVNCPANEFVKGSS